jgi:leader peptidase (prepilin peptidase) / N-methyltransferase
MRPLALRCPSGHRVRAVSRGRGSPPATVFAAAGVVTSGEPWLLPAYLVVAATTIVLLVTDIDHKLIPNRVLYPATAVFAVLLVAGALAGSRTDRLLPAAARSARLLRALFVVYLSPAGVSASGT